MRQDDTKTNILISCMGLIPIIWIALLIAPHINGGIVKIIENLGVAINNPTKIIWCENSIKTVLFFILVYVIGIGIYFANRKNYRRKEEHGSAKWGIAGAINKKYKQTPSTANKILTQKVSIGYNAKKHRRNLNTLVCGGSGAGKTRFYCKPNVMQANTSFVILDPKRRNRKRYRTFVEKERLRGKSFRFNQYGKKFLL